MTGMNDAQEALLLGMAIGIALFAIAIAVMKLHDLAERRRHRANVARFVVHLDSLSPDAILRLRA